MKWITLDFGTRRIKALKLTLDGQRLQIEDFLTIESKPEFFKGLAFPEPQAWAAVTVALNEADWLKADEEYVLLSALPSAYLETRYLKFPFRADKKIEKVIHFELEAAVPFDVEEIQLRHHVIEGEGVAALKKESLVLALAYKRELMKNFEGELKKFQLSNPPMTAEILALSSLRQAIHEPEVFGIMHFGHSKSELLFLQARGTLLGTKTFWWGGKNLIQGIAEEYNQDPKEAEHMLLHMDPEKKLPKLAGASTKQLVTELRQCLKGYELSGLELPKPLVIYVCGRPGKNLGVLEIIEEGLRAEFGVELRPYPIAQLRGRQLLGFERLTDADEALPALAIALSQMRQHRSKVPTFSETGFQFQQNLKKLKTGSFSVLKKVAALLILPFIYAILQIVIQERENEVLMGQLLPKVLEGTSFRLEPDETTDELVTRMKKELAANRQKIAQMQSSGESPLVVLTELSHTIPQHLKLDVKDLKISPKTILMSAETPTQETAQKIADVLKTIYPSLKMGVAGACAGAKTACKSFTIEIDREKKS